MSLSTARAGFASLRGFIVRLPQVDAVVGFNEALVPAISSLISMAAISDGGRWAMMAISAIRSSMQ